MTTTEGFSEAEATQRSRALLLEKNIDEIHEVTICFFAGVGEARGKGAIPVLPDITAKIRGRIVLNGTVPVLEIEDIDIGSAGFPIDLFELEGEIEDAGNLALDDLGGKLLAIVHRRVQLSGRTDWAEIDRKPPAYWEISGGSAWESNPPGRMRTAPQRF